MRIAIFAETYLPYMNGVVTHIKILRDGLMHHGHEVLIVTADKDVHEHVIEDGVLRCPALEFKKIYGYGISNPVSNTRRHMIRDFNPDIIHIQQEFSIGYAGIRAARALDIPLVYTLHTMYDDYVYYIAPWPLTDVVTRISHRYIRFIARRSDIITGPSKKCVDYLQNAGVHRKVYVIPNSVEFNRFGPDIVSEEDRLALRARLSIPADSFVACFCGRIGKEKGIDNLLKLWKNQTRPEENLYLLIIGSGPYLNEFQALAVELGISDRVIFTGAVPHDELAPYYSASDIYTTASLSEMYSISMLEAQASGLPVIQRLDPENKDQIQVGINGWLFESAEQFGTLVHTLQSKSPVEKRELRTSVRESVRERGEDSIAQYLLDLYELAIERHRKAPRHFPLNEQ
ncbi:MAG: glycosyltransferase [Oscillospiraceae bacterium]